MYIIDSKTRFYKFNAINDIFKYITYLPSGIIINRLSYLGKTPLMYMRTKSLPWDRELEKHMNKVFVFQNRFEFMGVWMTGTHPKACTNFK